VVQVFVGHVNPLATLNGSRTMKTGPEGYRPATAVDDVVRVPLLPSPDSDSQGLPLMVVSAGAMTWASVIGALQLTASRAADRTAASDAGDPSQQTLVSESSADMDISISLCRVDPSSFCKVAGTTYGRREWNTRHERESVDCGDR
jgi:hypothetical protein